MNNRISYAWGVLRYGIPEPELAYMPGEAQAAMLYVVHLYDWKFYQELGPRKTNQRWQFYETCAQAHAAHPTEPVKTVYALKAGGRYFFNNQLREIKVKRKPKRAKGKAAESLGRAE